jgi:DMSO/TMAO reductase YedYZ molybdopterin-dependent catalytic subunit
MRSVQTADVSKLPSSSQTTKVLSTRGTIYAVAGFVAGLAFAAALLAFQLFFGIESSLSVLQDKVVTLSPGAVTSGLIDRLQFAAKPLALTGLVLGQAAGMAVAAWLIDAFLPSKLRPLWSRGIVRGATLAAAIWVLAEIALVPSLRLGGSDTFAQVNPAQVLATALAAAIAGIIFAAVSAAAESSKTASAGSIEATSSPDPGRRRFVAAIIAAGTVGLSGALVAKTVEGMGEQGSPASRGVSNIGAGTAADSGNSGFIAPSGVSPYVTSTERFYVISKNLVDPNVSANGWTLEIKGLVDHSGKFSYADITSMPSTDVFATLECVSNTVGGDLMSNTRWTGVPMADLLTHAGVRNDAKWVNFGASDGYVEGLPIEAARRPGTLLAYKMDGKALPSKHGFPIRVLAPGNYGMKNPKWLTSIELSAQPPDGYWEKQGWNVENGIKTTARFDTRPRQATTGRSLGIGGVALAGDRGVSKVEVSFDGGQTWQAASLSQPASKATWVLWSSSWTPQLAGRAVLAVRAVDGNGQLQAPSRHEPYPSGATGYDEIQVQVGDPPQG